jgi:hypothetical protein
MKLLASLALILLGAAAGAQEVGNVATARGATEIRRGGVATAAAVGMAVQMGDELRTADGQLRVVFRDDSVVDLDANSTIVVDEHVFDPAAGSFSSLLKLVHGKARALVSEYYRAPGASYQIETPTAVAGVRGTSFIVAYHVDRDATEVIGIQGQIEVRSLAARTDAVYVSAQEATTILRGEAPTPPALLDERLFRDEVDGLELLAIGNFGSLSGARPLRAGASVPAPDRAPPATSPGGQLGRDQLRNTGDVVGQPLGVVESTRGRLGVPF